MTLLVPAVVGVPLRVPVPGSTDRPAGSPLALQVYGATPPVAVTGVAVHAAPTSACAGSLPEATSGSVAVTAPVLTCTE